MAGVLAIDVGQSGSRARALPAGRVQTDRPGQTDLPGQIDLPGLRGDQPVADQLVSLVGAAIERSGHTPDQVCVGCTGAEDPALATRVLSALDPAVRRVVVAHDSVTSHLGSLAGAPGVVVAAGTGSVALAVGRSIARVDGWGSLVGDAGSGYWIGRLAIDAVLRAVDGRGEPTALTELVTTRFGGLDALGLRLQAEPDRVRQIADCARDVAAVAVTDQVAGRIAGEAGHELARTVAAGWVRAEVPPGCGIASVGNVFAGAAVSAAFQRWLAELVPQGHRVTPVGDGLTGALQLSAIAPAHPLHDALGIATR